MFTFTPFLGCGCVYWTTAHGAAAHRLPGESGQDTGAAADPSEASAQAGAAGDVF